MEMNLDRIQKRLALPPGRRLRRCLRSTQRPFADNNTRAARSGKKVGMDSQYFRRKRFTNSLEELHALGYEIENARHIQHKHVRALVAYWLARDYSASTIRDRLSAIRTFLSWVGKGGMIGPATDYVSVADRHRVEVRTVAEEPKSWCDHGVDLAAKIALVTERNPRVAAVLLVCEVFGLRRREACTLRPHDALTELAAGAVLVTHGTKGGRDRVVGQFSPERQMSVLELACKLVDRPGASLIPKGKNLAQFLGTVRNVCHRAGMTRDEHCNPHAMRHSFANALYEHLSGYLAPVKGNGLHAPLDGDAAANREAQIDAARRTVSRNLGHNRTRITGAYIGGLRKARSKAVQEPLVQHSEQNPDLGGHDAVASPGGNWKPDI